MSHTPLLALFRRAHRLHQISVKTGVPVPELVNMQVEMRRAAQLSRRTFLAGSVVAVVGSACPQPAVPAATPKTVAVVGGGMAGLHCTRRLLALGVDDVTLYEAQDRLGGRMFTDRQTFAPLHAELGGELIDSGHETMLSLAEELGLTMLDYNDDLSGPDADLDAVVCFFNGARVSVADVLTAYAPIAARIDADLTTISGDGFVTYDANNGGGALDALSIKDWFDGLVDDGTIAADNIARQVFEVAYNIEYGRETSEQNVLNLLFLTSTDATSLALFGDSDERFHTAEGNDAFIAGMASPLSSHIESGHTLTAIKRGSDGRFVLSFDTAGGAVEQRADEVVIAIPFTLLRDVDIDDSVVLSAQKRLAIDTLGYGTNAKLMLGFTERFWRNKTGVNTSNGETFSDTGYQSTWETSRLQPGTEGILTNFTGGLRGVAAGEGSPAERSREFLQEFETIFPGIGATHNNKVARFHWPTNQFVKASYACYLPGQYTTITGAEAEAEADGHLHFCGEHTSLDFQGYMEGAAVSGAAAAVAVAENLSVNVAALVQALTLSSPQQRILQRAWALRLGQRLRPRR